MKIHSVHFKNLNSLRGVFFIPFTEGALAESGLFAITGPTGAGKTTILDAITVALYNRVPRHGTNVEELMSRHTGECWSEVVFETGGRLYRSKWSLNRAHNKADGKLQQDKMELADAQSGEMLGGHRKTETLDLIENITGLDYEQFLRSVMLAQGEFSRFLKANTKERSELLEQMTDSFVFSRISKFVFDKARTEKEKRDLIQVQTAQFASLAEEALQAKMAEKAAAEQKLAMLRTQEDTLRNAVLWFDKKTALAQEQEHLNREREKWQQDGEQLMPAREKLLLHHKAQPAAPVLRQIEQLEGERETAKQEKINVEAALALLQQQAAAALQARHVAETALAAAVTHNSEQLPRLEEAIRLSDLLLVKNEALAQLQNRLNALKQSIALHKQEHEVNNGQIEEAKQHLAGVQDWLSHHAARKTMDEGEQVLLQQANNLQHLAAAAKRLQAAAENLEQQKTTLSESLHALAETEKKAGAETAALEAELQGVENAMQELLGNSTPAQLQQSLEQIPQRVADIRECLRISEEFITTLQQSETAQQSITAHEEALAAITAQGKQTGALLTEAEAHLIALQTLLEQEKLLQAYSAHRHLLEDGKPCPLCGATEHPFATDAPVLVLQQREDACMAQQSRIDELKATIQGQRDDFRSRTLEKQNAEKQAQQADIQATQLRAAFTKAAAAIEQPLPINATEAWRIRYDTEYNAWQVLLETRQQLAPLLLQQQQWQASLQQLQSHLQLEAVKRDNLKASLQQINQRLTDNGKEQRAQQDAYEALASQMEALVTPFGIVWHATQPDTALAQYRQYKEAYRKHAEEAKHVEAEIARFVVAGEHIYRQVAQQEKDAQQLEQSLQEAGDECIALQAQITALSGEKNPAATKKQLLHVEQTARDTEKAARENWQLLANACRDAEANLKSLLNSISDADRRLQAQQAELQQALAAGGFATRDALSAALLPEPEAARIAEQVQEHDRLKEKLNTLAAKNSRDLTEHMLLAPAVAEETAARQTLEALQEEVAALNRKAGALASELAEDARRKQQHAAKLLELEQQQQAYLRWENLNKLIGSATGDKFRSFAQGLTLQHLTLLANRHLRTFSTRYLLVKRPGDNLDLEITDGWQADISRPISTLSGGETFLVSLALALGLSDLASNKVQIGSLFIDEGFGTLDAETLEVAMDALENLREAGKTIGIISHVAAMQERITTQVRIKPMPGGYSRIEMHP